MLRIVHRSAGLVLPVLLTDSDSARAVRPECGRPAQPAYTKASSFSNTRPNRQLICPASGLSIPGVPVSGVSVWHLVANSLRVVGVCMYP